MKIVALEAVPFSVPLRRRTAFAHGSISSADHVLVRVRTDEGIIGQAEAPARPFTYGESQLSIVHAVQGWFSEALVGSDPFDREQARADMSWLAGNHAARGAVDMAIWDVLGKACGLSVHQMLGGYSDHLRVAHILFAPTPEGMKEEAQEVGELFGIRTFKIKTGKDPRVDATTMRLVRDAVGPEIELYIDANKGWTTDETLRLLPLMEELMITMLEEPTPAAAHFDRRRLAGRSAIPIVADESARSLEEVAAQLLDSRAHLVSIKTARTGFSESQRILGLCEGLGVGTLIGNQLDGAVGTMGSLAFGAAFRSTARHAAELTFFHELVDDVVTSRPTIRNGVMRVPGRPGVGIDIDEDKLHHYRVDR